MIWSTDPQGRCTYVSKKLSELTGRGERDGLGSGWLDIVHPDDRPVVQTVLAEACQAQEPFSFQYRMRIPGASYRWVISGAAPSFGPADQAFLGFLGSITEIDEGASFHHAFGQVGSFQHPQPRPSTTSQSEIDITTDHLLLARASAKQGRQQEIVAPIDLALELVARRITKLRPIKDPRLN